MIKLIPIVLLTGCTALKGITNEGRQGKFSCWADCDGDMMNCDFELNIDESTEDQSVEVER